MLGRHFAFCIVHFALNILLFSLVGCAGYQVGAGSLYAPDVSTVFVPMIESDSYRRDLGERLTEAVVKEIELKTPYKVVGTPDADSILSARLVRDARRTLVENAFDDPRVSETELIAEVTWLNRRRQPIAPAQAVVLPPELVIIHQTSTLIPEVGQSVVTAQQQAIERLAQQIVSTMEAPW
jgi:Lipopolysaccharide-assembly